jgi:hypothetical protein
VEWQELLRLTNSTLKKAARNVRLYLVPTSTLLSLDVLALGTGPSLTQSTLIEFPLDGPIRVYFPILGGVLIYFKSCFA